MSPEFRRIVDRIGGSPGVEAARMFGSDGLKIRGKVFAMDVGGKLVVKVSSDRAAALVSAGWAKPFDPGHGRIMKQWIAVSPEAKRDWLDLAKEALDFVGGQAAIPN